VIIRLEKVSKIFRRRPLKRKHITFRESLLNFKWARNRQKARYEEALKDVSLNIERGESIGVIGMNAAGKTTLLKLMAGIYKPTSGKVDIKGRVASVIGLGIGFHPEFTGRENVFINGIILGLSKKEIRRRFDDIVNFAELEDYIDEPVRTYSGGMFMRLGFSVAINVDPDTLLIDEILDVGDEYFQHKCVEKIAEFRRLDKTMVVVSHNLEGIERWCNRVVWLDRGIIREIGIPGEVIGSYQKAIAEKEGEIPSQTRSSQSNPDILAPK